MDYRSFRNKLLHRNDKILHQGFDYRGKILSKSLSNVFYLDPKRQVILDYMDEALTYMIDHIKQIKKSFNWTLPKYYRDFN